MTQKHTTDFSTSLGILLSFILIMVAISIGGSAKSFLDAPSVLIVIGGTFAITTACFSFKEMLGMLSLVTRTTVYAKPDPTDKGINIIALAEKARKDGMLVLQGAIVGETQPILRKGITMLVDGYKPEEVELMMQQKIRSRIERHERGASILRKAGEISPAMGLIGTLIGLVQMLGNLDDPSSIGPAMAVALLTTLYGAILAYLVFIPLASKLERNSQEELLVDTICAKGISAIGRQENPRKLEIEFNTILPPSKQFNYFNE